MTAQVALDGTMQEAACLTQIEQMLMSTLWPGDFVVMDILPATLVSLLPMPSAGPVRNCASFRPKARTLADRAKKQIAGAVRDRKRSERRSSAPATDIRAASRIASPSFSPIGPGSRASIRPRARSRPNPSPSAYEARTPDAHGAVPSGAVLFVSFWKPSFVPP